jgi:hypothetical protein
MKSVYVCNREIALSSRNAIGKGGEADVYSIGGRLALKVFKTPDHPDLQALDPAERQSLIHAAEERIETHQRKLRVFPHGLPASVLAPVELAYDRKGHGGRIIGYTMPFVEGADLLFQYGKRAWRESALNMGINEESVRDLLLELHEAVRAIHAAGVVIGDFNDLNVLVKGKQVYMADADSFQYGGFLCNTFQYRFLDPLLCEPLGPRPTMCRPHNTGSDWYAYAAMLMQSLLCVDPYGGLHKPADPSHKVADLARPLHRLTVFNPEVQYPKAALPLYVLPDDLLQHLHATFERDVRGEFPRALLQELRWTDCLQCGGRHARHVCPFCTQPGAILAGAVQIEAQEVRGQVVARLIFRTAGRIVAARVQGGRLLWLYEEGGELKRESGTVVTQGTMRPGMAAGLSGSRTHLAMSGMGITLKPGHAPERRLAEQMGAHTAFASNSRHAYWIDGGYLYREGALNLGPFLIGEVLAHATRFWVGETFGFGFYRAGGLSGAFVFDGERAGIDARVGVPLPRGQIVDAGCVFGDDRCWLMISAQEGGSIIDYCTVILRDGRVIATHKAAHTDGLWPGSIHRGCAAGAALLAPTDAGIVRLEAHGGSIHETKTFPDTEAYVSAESKLYGSQDGLYVVGSNEIRLLRMGT